MFSISLQEHLNRVGSVCIMTSHKSERAEKVGIKIITKTWSFRIGDGDAPGQGGCKHNAFD